MATRSRTVAPWSAAGLGNYLVRFILQRKSLIIVPECYWAGEEADLLAVTNDLRLIDIEIKLTRSDLKADVGKEKWWKHPKWWQVGERPPSERRDWPPKIWKHYYCMPASVWKPDLEEIIPKNSGVLLVSGNPLQPFVSCERRSKPNRDAGRISAEDAIDIARLAGLRMWAARKLAEDIRAGRA